MDNLIKFPWYVSLPVCRRLSLLLFFLIWSVDCSCWPKDVASWDTYSPPWNTHITSVPQDGSPRCQKTPSLSPRLSSRQTAGRQTTLLKEGWPIRVGLLHNAELTRRAARSYLECGPCSILPLKLQLQHFLHFPNLTCWKTENQRLVIRRGSCGPFHGVGRPTDPPTRIVGDSRLNPRVLNVRKFWASYPSVCIYLMLQHGIYTHRSTPPQLKKLPSVSTDR